MLFGFKREMLARLVFAEFTTVTETVRTGRPTIKVACYMTDIDGMLSPKFEEETASDRPQRRCQVFAARLCVGPQKSP
ncbi:MAG TPA: hypothetical protein VKC66_18270 [Xanthobacteraceae bacterium]|nr:hypothetical protein [Xanthobacteraceae bacterium]